MISLSVCMIVKNEEKVLDRILSQVKAIADEIIIVDTGSCDGTKSIAKQYTDLVFDFKWCQDFSAARNFSCSKATKDYFMWLDADDVITPDNSKKLLELKESLDPSCDIVMMKYAAGFDEQDRPSFSYYRERLIKNNCGYKWEGKVHETIAPRGRLLYSDIEIEHRKNGSGDPDRNLNIYESIISSGESLEPRHQFYYARELLYHKRYSEAADIFEYFLKEPDGWIENKIDACMQLSHCYEKLGKSDISLLPLFYSFALDVPRAEVCCTIGNLFTEHQQYKQAIYWYRRALECEYSEYTGAFVQKECYGFIPYIQLCVCYDRIGDHKKAYEYHKLSEKLNPGSEAVRLNKQYFDTLFKNSAEQNNRTPNSP